MDTVFVRKHLNAVVLYLLRTVLLTKSRKIVVSHRVFSCFAGGKHRVRLYAGRRSGRKPGPTLGGLLAERQKEEKIAPVWPCEPLCALFPERAAAMRTPTLLERVWASFWEFAEDERKSRRKNRRFCGAGSLTTARSAGSCGVLKGRSSACEIKAMTLFSAKFGCLLRAARTIRGVPGLFERFKHE